MGRETRSDNFEISLSSSTDIDRTESLMPLPCQHADESIVDLSLDRRGTENRRSRVLQALFYGNFRPRRRIGRRESDRNHFFIDWHEPRILYLAMCVLLLSCTDALFTLKLIDAGAVEGNPVMASMLELGIDRFLASKIGLTSLSLVVLVVAARRILFKNFSVQNLLQLLCMGYVLVIYYEIYLFRYVFEVNIF